MIEDLRATIAARLGPEAVSTARADLAGYEQGARYGAGRAAMLIRPADAAGVAFALRACRALGLHVVPQGANTGLVAASTPDGSGTQVVLSLERLRAPIEINPLDRTALVGAGVRLSALNEALALHGLCFPIDLGADPSIGGMIAANTGGARLIRHGDVRRNLLGLEVVLADGTVLDLLNRNRKNNTGIDLKQLFVGSSGALGVITRAVVEVHPLPRQSATALLVPQSPEAVPGLIGDLEAALGDFLSACEGMSRNAMACALRHRPRVRNPFQGGVLPDYAVLVELTASCGSDVVDLQAMLEDFLGPRLEDGLADAIFGRPEDLWALRHAISDSLKEDGRVIAFDIAMPRSALPAFRAAAAADLARDWPCLRVCDFGHSGDGGDHFNLVWPNDAPQPFDPACIEPVRALIYDRVVRDHGGSFSAEHGVGPYNQAYYDRYTTPERLALSGAIKHLLDPEDRLGVVRFGPPDTTDNGAMS